MAKSLKLFTQLVLITSTVALIAICFFLIFAVTNMKHFGIEMDETLKKEVYSSISKSILADEKRLNDLAINNAHWTDFQVKMKEGDVPWVEANATKHIIDDPRFSASILYVFDVKSQYKEIHGKLPESVFLQIMSHTDILSLEKEHISYIVVHGGKNYILTAVTITDNEVKNPSGFYILGNEIGDAYISGVLDDFRHRATMDVRFDNKRDEIIGIMNDRLPKAVENAYLIEDAVKRIFSIEIKDNFISDISKKTMETFVIFTLSLIAVGLCVLYSYFWKIGRNIEKSVTAIEAISEMKYKKRINLHFSKEFDNLGNCINKLSVGLEMRDREIEKNYIELITVLIKALEEVDRYTRGHSERVSHYSVELAKVAGYKDIEQIRIGGLLHDMGKISIDSSILNKPGRLTEEEFKLIREHPTVAFNILSMSDIFANTKYIIRHHHERVDGTGYPDGIKGPEIPLGSKIIAIADTFDALTSRRSYRKKISAQEALLIMDQDVGTQFDVELYLLFKEIAEEIHGKWSDITDAPTVSEISS